MDRAEEIDYEPFPDKYPKLNLISTTMESCSTSDLSGEYVLKLYNLLFKLKT